MTTQFNGTEFVMVEQKPTRKALAVSGRNTIMIRRELRRNRRATRAI